MGDFAFTTDELGGADVARSAKSAKQNRERSESVHCVMVEDGSGWRVTRGVWRGGGRRGEGGERERVLMCSSGRRLHGLGAEHVARRGTL